MSDESRRRLFRHGNELQALRIRDAVQTG